MFVSYCLYMHCSFWSLYDAFRLSMLQKRKQIQGPFKSFMKCAVKTVNNTQQGAGNVHFVQFQHDYRQETNVT